MREKELETGQKLDLQLANTIWTTNEWIRFCVRNNVGITIEDGKVTGFESNPIKYKS